MTATQTTYPDAALVDLLSQQRGLYQQLNELAHKQSDLVAGGDSEMLLRILAGRQRILDRIGQIDKQLAPLRRDWPELRRQLAPEQQTEVQQLLDDVQGLLAQIIERDARDTAALSGRQQEVAGEIRSASVGKRMHRAYNQAAVPQDSRFFDTGLGQE